VIKKAFIVFLLLFFTPPAYATELTSQECTDKGGLIVSGDSECLAGQVIGTVTGLKCLCICCTGEKVIDCKNNSLKILSACDAGDEFRYRFKFKGTETPKTIFFSLKSKSWMGGTDWAKIGSADKEQHILLNKIDQNKNYTAIDSYTVIFKSAPLSSCTVNPDKAEIVPCEAESK
jgi:hypothetical protein